MRSFASIGELAVHLAGVIAVEAAAEHHALERAAVLIERTAKGKLGEYQPGWAPLAAATLADKESHGWPIPSPLLRGGEMRASIEHQVSWPEAHVGSDDQIAVWQELGTSKMPARSFLALSAAEKGAEIAEIIGAEVTLALSGEGVMGSAGRMAITGDY